MTTLVTWLQNNLAYALGNFRVWQASYRVGRFGGYDMNTVRGR